MNQKIDFCSLDELRTAGSVTRWVEEWKDEVTAFWLGAEEIVAVSSVCPHNGGPLKRRAGGSTAACGWHGWEFDLKGGGCLNHPVKPRLRRYRLEAAKGRLELWP